MVTTTRTRPPANTSTDAPSAARIEDTSARTAAGHRRHDLGLTLTAFYVIVIVVAGGSAVALLGWPAHSGTFFSWDLGASPVAATIGGLYLASVATFGAALPRSRSQVRSLSIGVLALALPTLWFTVAHQSVFDWSRPQAVAWVVLFLSAPISISSDLRTPPDPDDAPKAGPGTRATLMFIAFVGIVGAGVLWIEPLTSSVAAHSPISVGGLTGRYLGAWCAFLAATASTAAARGRTTDARLTAVLLGTASIGLIAAVGRTSDQLGPNVAAYVASLSAIGIVAVLLHRANGATDERRAVDPDPSGAAVNSSAAADDRIRS